MKKAAISILLLLSVFFLTNSEEVVTRRDGTKVILYQDHTWREYEESAASSEDLVQKYKNSLRSGINASPEQILIACEMLDQGWSYTMPKPKSAQAAWGNTDGRTTWYTGWWYNTKTRLYSATTPRKSNSGLFIGDNQNTSNSWRNGGSPPRPDIYMFLLSSNGGPRF